jgi:primosomal protein N' (replication factor Y)
MDSPLFPPATEGPRFADVILPLSLPQTLTYGIPASMQGLLLPGMRVEVALGRNRLYAGVVERIHDEQPQVYQVKPIRQIIDERPVVNETQLRFWNWIARYYMAEPGDVMQAALPAHLKLAGETRLQWAPHEDVVYEWSNETWPAAELLEQKKEVSLSELRALVGQRHLTQVINELLEQEAVVINDSLEATYRPRKERMVALAPAYADEQRLSALFDELSRAPRQLELLMAYVQLAGQHKHVRQADLLDRTGANAAQVKALAEKGVFVITEQAVDRLIFDGRETPKALQFTPAQQRAYAQLEAELKKKPVTLLQGVTGSGKTMLYIHKIRECLATGKQVLFLLPEIGLTTQLVSRLYAYFGEEMGVYHSRFSDNERVEIWEKVRSGKYRLVVGPRSALWLPYAELGLIIVDEEHDGSYKQKDPAPRFHARDAAIYLASLHNAEVILGSATPSVESLYNVQQGKYGHVRLDERYQGVQMPEIVIVNAASLSAVRREGLSLMTPELRTAIAETLQKQKQVILFQNRRGYAPFQICTICGWVPQCKNCAVSLTYHKITDKLHCHYCGLKTSVIHTCPACGSNRLMSRTFGTEKIEEEVQQVFPKARIARMDVDSMRGKDRLPQLLEQLEKGKIDILVGTQMVVKGLDFAAVGLVGILSADSLLSYPDFRVNERAFQLMEQVSGRAGRADGAGRVLIQAHNVQHPVLKWVQEHDVAAFYEQEIQAREAFCYPPFSRLMRIIFRHKDEPKAREAAGKIAAALQQRADVIVQGPAPALVPRVRNQYIQEVWVKCPRHIALDPVKSFIRDQKHQLLQTKGFSGVQVVTDVDPVG